MYMYMHVCMYVCMCIYIYIYIYISIHTHVCVYIYIYIHTWHRLRLQRAQLAVLDLARPVQVVAALRLGQLHLQVLKHLSL